MGHVKSSGVREYIPLLVFIAILSLLLCIIAPVTGGASATSSATGRQVSCSFMS